MNTMIQKWFLLLGLTFAFTLVTVPPAQAQVTVRGTIVSIDGTPLRGDVTLIRGGPDVRLRSHHTDSQGVFSIRTDRAPGQLLVAKADGHVSSEVELGTAGNAARLNVRFRLWPAGKVSGRVVDEKGNGVAGATLQVRYPGERRRHYFHHEVGDIQADDFGYFTLPFIARGKSFVVGAATAERLPGATAPLTLEGKEKSGVQVTAGKVGHVVQGAVRDSAANPHRGATVRLRLSASLETTRSARVSRLHARSLNQKTLTGRDGAYQFKGLPAGRVVVIDHVPGRTPTKQGRVVPDQGSSGVYVIDLIVD